MNSPLPPDPATVGLRLRSAVRIPQRVVKHALFAPSRMRRTRLENLVFGQVVGGSAVFSLSDFGGEYEIDLRSDLARRIMLDGEYESHLAQICSNHVDPDRDAIDVGGNVGLYTGLLASRLNNGRRVLTFEPTPRAFELLLNNIARNNLEKRVIPVQMVASDREGNHELSICPGREEYSSCGPIVHPSAKALPVQSRSVVGTTVDSACLQHHLRLGFVKIDVEGYEQSVLRGAEETIRRDRPVILAEVSDLMLRACGASSKAVLDWLRQMDYRTFDADKPGVEVAGRFNGEVLALPE